MADVFISYSSRNREQAVLLARVLSDLGLSVWWDREIPTGASFDHAIERQLENAACVVVLWSIDSAGSEWVRNEAAAALDRGVLLPARLDGVKLPLEFRRRQTADLTEWSGDPRHHGFQSLYRAIQDTLGSSRSAAPGPQQDLASPGRRRSALIGAGVAVIVLGIGAILYLGRSWDQGFPIALSGSSVSEALPQRNDSPGSNADAIELADLVAGSYAGEIIADSLGSSRSNVVVVLEKRGPDTVRITSPNSRIGSLEVELTRIDRRILNAGGDSPFIVELDADPPTLALDPRGELAFRGWRRK